MSKRLGNKIRMFRAIKGYSQEYVAEAMGMSAGNFGKIERGEIDINSNHLEQIAGILKISVGELFEDKHVFRDKQNSYGFATKDELYKLTETVHLLAKEMKELRESLPSKTVSKNKNKRSK